MENDAVKEISDFWAECGKNGTTEKIISYSPDMLCHLSMTKQNLI